MQATQIHPKVAASTIGAAVSIIGCGVFTAITHDNVPLAVAGAITTVVTFALGWLVPSEFSSDVTEDDVVTSVATAVADTNTPVAGA